MTTSYKTNTVRKIPDFGNTGRNIPDFSNTIYWNTDPTENTRVNTRLNKKRRITNLFYSIINHSSATLFEPKSISDIFKHYNEILSEKYNTSDSFKKSMKNSLSCFRNPENYKLEISKLQNNNSESFVVMPLFSSIHTLSAVIRKQSDGLTFTLVDKFTTHFSGITPNSPYATEYTIKGGALNKLVDELNNKAFQVDTPEIFETVKKYSKESNVLKIKHREQKIFTCLYKEPEAGIKFAFATRNFSNQDFKKLRSENSFSDKFKVKWDEDINSTIDIHKRFLEKIQSSNKDINLSNLDKVFNNYVENKIFRRELKKTKDFNHSLSFAFDRNNKLNHFSQSEKRLQLIKKINLDSIHQIPELRRQYASIFTARDGLDLVKTRFNTQIFGTYAYVFTNHNLDLVLKTVKDMEKKLPIFSQQAKDYHSVVNTVVAYALFEMYIDKNNKSLSGTKEKDFDWIMYKIDKSIEAGPYSDKAHFIRGTLKLNKGLILKEQNNLKKSQDELIDSIKSLENTLKLNPDFTPAKLFLSVAYKNIGAKEKALVYFRDASKDNFVIDSELKLVINNRRVHFNCITKEVANEITGMKSLVRQNNTIPLKM